MYCEESTMKRILIFGVGLAALSATGPWERLDARARAVDDEKPAIPIRVDASKQAMLKAAKNTYEATRAAYEVGTETLANVFLWSRRWLEAELAVTEDDETELAAFNAHWDRMNQIHGKIKALFGQGVRGGEAEKLHASEFYLAEAEFWLVTSGGSVPR
jgi:hypothetical protein